MAKLIHKEITSCVDCGRFMECTASPSIAMQDTPIPEDCPLEDAPMLPKEPTWCQYCGNPESTCTCEPTAFANSGLAEQGKEPQEFGDTVYSILKSNGVIAYRAYITDEIDKLHSSCCQQIAQEIKGELEKELDFHDSKLLGGEYSVSIPYDIWQSFWNKYLGGK